MSMRIIVEGKELNLTRSHALRDFRSMDSCNNCGPREVLQGTSIDGGMISLSEREGYVVSSGLLVLGTRYSSQPHVAVILRPLDLSYKWYQHLTRRTRSLNRVPALASHPVASHTSLKFIGGTETRAAAAATDAVVAADQHEETYHFNLSVLTLGRCRLRLGATPLRVWRKSDGAYSEVNHPESHGPNDTVDINLTRAWLESPATWASYVSPLDFIVNITCMTELPDELCYLALEYGSAAVCAAPEARAFLLKSVADGVRDMREAGSAPIPPQPTGTADASASLVSVGRASAPAPRSTPLGVPKGPREHKTAHTASAVHTDAGQASDSTTLGLGAWTCWYCRQLYADGRDDVCPCNKQMCTPNSVSNEDKRRARCRLPSVDSDLAVHQAFPKRIKMTHQS